MNCPQCGQLNPAEASRCTKCGAVLSQQSANPFQSSGKMGTPQPGMTKPSSFLPLAIISAIPCCGCFPLGIVAIVFSMQVDSKWNAGDFTGAKDSSNKAKIFSIISLAIFILLVVGYLVFVGIFVMTNPEFQQKLKEAQEQQQRQQQQFNGNKGARYELPADWYVREYADSTPSSAV
jgi:hypothetical protein